MKVGDSIGGIYKRSKDGVEGWYLCEDKITRIIENKKGKKYYTKSKFHPLDCDNVDHNTEIMEKAEGYILVREVFGLNDITRPKAEGWVNWANTNKDKVESMWGKID